MVECFYPPLVYQGERRNTRKGYLTKGSSMTLLITGLTLGFAARFVITHVKVSVKINVNCH